VANTSSKLTTEAKRFTPVRTVTESRLLDLVRWHPTSRSLYVAGAAADTLEVLDYRCFYICRAVQAWQFTPGRFAAAWIDSGRDGILIYTQREKALEKFELICRVLEAKDPPASNSNTREQP
jgi:hypothetical protein